MAAAVAVCLRWGMYELICGSGLGVDDERITIERYVCVCVCVCVCMIVFGGMAVGRGVVGGVGVGGGVCVCVGGLGGGEACVAVCIGTGRTMSVG